MEDEEIIDLYFSRSETAISETQVKYGRILQSIAYGILRNLSDAEECENDTYLKTWNSIPPERPGFFSAFLSRIVRNLSLDRYDMMNAKKRGSGEIPLILEELDECVPDDKDAFGHLEEQELTAAINEFLDGVKPDARNIFMRRYWFGDSIQEIAEKGGYGPSKVKMSLSRTRNSLKKVLKQKGYEL